MSLTSFIYAYLLGGITFIPGIILLVLYHVYKYGSVPIGDPDPFRRIQNILSTSDSEPKDLPSDSSSSSSSLPSSNTTSTVTAPDTTTHSHTPLPKSTPFPAPRLSQKHLTGWLTVRRTFEPEKWTAKGDTVVGNFKNGLTELRAGAGGGGGAGSGQGEKGEKAEKAEKGEKGYSNLFLNSYRSIKGDPPQNSTPSHSPSSSSHPHPAPTPSPTSKTKELVFCALKGNVLFMYQDPTMDTCLGVIGLEAYSVGITSGRNEWGEGGGDEDDSDSDSDNDSDQDSDEDISEGEKERLTLSGLDPSTRRKLRSQAKRRNEREKAKRGSPLMDGELFAKRNAIVLRAVPVSSPAVGAGVAKVGGVGGRRKSIDLAGEVGTQPHALSSGRRGSLPYPTEHPLLQRKSTPPSGGRTDRSVLPGPNPSHPSQPELGPASGPTLTSLTLDMDRGMGTSGVGDERKTLLQESRREREGRRREKRRRERERVRREGRPWFLFAKNNVRQEEWYHALLLQSHPDPPSSGERPYPARPTFDNVFSRTDMQRLIDTLNEDGDSIPVRWLNAMIGRVFLGICGTAALEAFIIGKFMKKVQKVKTPSFLGDIVVKEVDVGRTAPYFSKPMLKELTAEGEAAFEVAIHYTGDVRITIGTTAIIPTGFGFKPYTINLELVVLVQGVHGNLCVRIKKPPSNRIWWGFTSMPKLDLRVVPVVSDRKIQINMVLKAIEKQIRDAVAESIVLPNMDDLAFFDTRHLRTRGGIFDEASKKSGIPVKADIGPDGLEPFPIAGSRHVDRPNEDTGVNKLTSKVSAVQPSMAVDALDLPEGKAARIANNEKAETASIGQSSTHSITKSISESTKKWLANKSGILDNSSDDAKDVSPPGESTKRSIIEKTGAGFEVRPGAGSTSAEAVGTSVEAVTSGDSGSKVIDRPQDDNVSLDRLPRADQLRSQGTTGIATSDSQSSPRSSIHEERDPSNIHLQGTSAATLMNSIRARTADKKALQSSVNEARETMRKWGQNWAAKRSGAADLTVHEQQIADKLHAVENNMRRVQAGEQQAAEPRPRTTSRLQERLAVAASQAKTPPAAPSRNLPRQSLEGGLLEPSSFGLSSSGPSQKSHRTASFGDHNTSPVVPVRQQPSAAPAMTVPRVPKRPDAVTAISSTSYSTPTAATSVSASAKTTHDMGQNTATSSDLPKPGPLIDLLDDLPPSSSSTQTTSRPHSVRGFEIQDLPEDRSSVSAVPHRSDGPARTASDALKGLVAADALARSPSKPTTPTTERPH